MFRRWLNERLIRIAVVSFYEPVSPRERERLAQAARRDPELRREIATLRGVRNHVHLETPALDVDLTAAVRARLAEAQLEAHTSRPIGFPRWRAMAYGAVLTTAAAVMLVVTIPGIRRATPATEPYRAPTPPARSIAMEPREFPVSSVLAQACHLVDQGDPARARQLLTDTVAQYPDDPGSGEALAMLADLEFSEFHRFDKAEEYYELLRVRYPEIFMKTRDAVDRYTLLAEAAPMYYEPLYTLVNARKNGESMNALERLMARYPDTRIAQEAMRTLTAFHADGPASSPADVASALQRARARCAEPVAAAQFDLALGNLYRDRLKDPDRAARYFNEAATCGQEYVARPAREALASLRYNSQ
ncbi:MAG TPA: tetratricopeptide repeat protein [Candidatus Hydrogenedentes bacterium]|nr:tetratricopeptide repeat protein [Candidatus Hydrogenedentota bacterium]